MAKDITILADSHKEEHYKALMKLPEMDLCEMIRAHFESHPTLPGEKPLKEMANNVLNTLKETQRILSEKQMLPHNGFEPALETPFDNDSEPSIKEQLAQGYAQTRIRQTPLKEGNYYLDFRHYDPSDLCRKPVATIENTTGAPTIVEKVNVELQNNGAGNVYVLADLTDGGHRTIGKLPENFLTNNPMNVESCSAELQIADYSNGNLKNISARVVVDTDLMSGDVIDLDNNMLAGLDQKSGLEQ